MTDEPTCTRMNESFFVLKDGENLGPFTLDELKNEVQCGRFTSQDIAGIRGSSDLRRIGHFLNPETWEQKPQESSSPSQHSTEVSWLKILTYASVGIFLILTGLSTVNNGKDTQNNYWKPEAHASAHAFSYDIWNLFLDHWAISGTIMILLGCGGAVAKLQHRSQEENERQPPQPSTTETPKVKLASQTDFSHSATSTTNNCKTLWNPWTITILSIILGCLFGSALIALNWHYIGKHRRGALAWILGAATTFIQFSAFDYFPGAFPYILAFLFWFPIQALPQIIFLHSQSQNLSLSRSIWIPAGIGLAANIVMFIPWGSTPANPSINRSHNISHFKEYSPEELAQQVSPYVVEIHTRWKEPYLYIFQRNNGADGSAVLIKAQKDTFLFVTNRHVVEAPASATEIQLTLTSQDITSPVAITLAAYEKSGIDLALVTLHADGLKEEFSMPVRPIKALTIGEPCIAIGNALGKGTSVTTGILSRIDVMSKCTVIRTSAPISPGNSGGGLFSLHGGALIGITSASNVSDYAQNINYAIPTDYFTRDDVWTWLK